MEPTYGDLSSCECPVCGKIMENLSEFDFTHGDAKGSCEHCDADILVSLDYSVTCYDDRDTNKPE